MKKGETGIIHKEGKISGHDSSLHDRQKEKCGLIIPAYLAKKYEMNNRNNEDAFYVVLKSGFA